MSIRLLSSLNQLSLCSYTANLTWLDGATYNLNLTYARYCPEATKLTVEEGWSSLRTIALQTVGCKLNQAETESLVRKFLQAGFEIVAPQDAADIYLLNTCTVTHVADHKCRKLLRVAHRRNPAGLIIAAGCYAERAPDELNDIHGVDLVIGNRDKEKAVDIVRDRLNGHSVHELHSKSQMPSLRTRSLVKIQEGCSQPCSFCIVPRVRGPESSRPEEEIISEVNALIVEGHKEAILTGTRIGQYECDGGLPELIEHILTKCGIRRLRLSSLEPSDITPELLKLWKNSRLCRHIHLPLQSGSDSVLERMGRSYSVSDYERAVTMTREAIPDIAITTDIMVGFAGETDMEFNESYEFCRGIGFANMHVFPYSARPGTRAVRLGVKVKDSEKKRRTDLLLNLASKSARDYRERFLGKTMDVLWEGRKDGLWFGFTDNYIRVFLYSDEPLGNRLLKTRLLTQKENGLRGELTS